MIKKIIILLLSIVSCISLFAQDYAQWPADKPETDNIEASQSKQIRLGNSILPQEINMQDKMRVLITVMMHDAAKKLGWDMTELSEYTNGNAMQGAGTPYALRSPRGIEITFQFIVNKDSLQAWKNYQLNYGKSLINSQMQSYNNITAITQSPLYKRYQDSVNYYINLYTTYTTAHQNEGAALFTKDKHPKYYQQKENEFINKMTAMTQQVQDNSGMQQMEDEHDLKTFQFRNNTVVQVNFQVNNFTAVAIDQALGPIKSTYISYSLPHSKLYTIPKKQANKNLVKWKNVILVLLGNFLTKPNDYGYYDAGFNHNSQGDEHTPKKIKSDKVQNISINIYGGKSNIQKMAKLIDVEKLNNEITNN
jgi:hypothetical protein